MVSVQAGSPLSIVRMAFTVSAGTQQSITRVDGRQEAGGGSGGGPVAAGSVRGSVSEPTLWKLA